MDYYDEQQGYQMPPPSPYVRMESKDPNFNQWFLDNKETIKTMRMYWLGFERDENDEWVLPPMKIRFRLMNERGCHWVMQQMEMSLSNTYLFTNWDREEMNYEMRQFSRALWRGLTHQYLEFGLSKINAYVIGKQVLSQMHAMMLSARGEGIRKYLGSVQQISEIRQINNNDEKKGWVGGILDKMRGRGNQYG